MTQWLIADITFLDVHLQLSMLLVTALSGSGLCTFGRPGSVRYAAC
jgi:hypothetical protein